LSEKYFCRVEEGRRRLDKRRMGLEGIWLKMAKRVGQKW
jgi:hypothetical protein